MATRAQIRRLLRDPERVLHLIGVYMVSATRRAFDEQRSPVGAPWLRRYPRQVDYKLNIAGALGDLAEGPRIKGRRYDSRPAGIDTGDMRGRVTYEVRGNELMVGSNVPYARRFHEGGDSHIHLTATMIANLRQVVAKAKKKKRRGQRIPEDRLTAVAKAFDAGETIWVTTSPPRPLVGLGQQDMADLTEQIHDLAGEM